MPAMRGVRRSSERGRPVAWVRLALVSALACAGARVALLSASPLSATPQAKASAPKEKELLDAFKKAFASSDPSAREAAVTTLGEASRQLPDQGAGKKVAQALALGLEDPELMVGAASCFQLGRERDVDTVIGALEKALRMHRAELESKIRRSDVEARNYVVRATVLFRNACRVLANYRDDRSAACLVGLLAKVPPETKENDLALQLVTALAPTTLELGTQAAFETAVKRLAGFDASLPEGAASQLLEALEEAATRAELPGPKGVEATPAGWQAWLELNKGRLPTKLGRLTAPPTSEPRLAQDGLPGYGG